MDSRIVAVRRGWKVWKLAQKMGEELEKACLIEREILKYRMNNGTKVSRIR